MTSYLIGDIGRKHARFKLYASTSSSAQEKLLSENEFFTKSYSGLTSVVKAFLAEFENVDITVACFSLPGPVKNGAAKLTNLGWSTTEEELEAELDINEVIFLNNFQAAGYGLDFLPEDEFRDVLQQGNIPKNRPVLLIGSGTELGEAYIIQHEGKKIVIPGHGGHADFAPTNREEFDMMQFIKRKLNLSRIGVGRIVSGPGIENIYWFFANTKPSLEKQKVSATIRSSEYPSKVISELAKEKKDAICQKTMKMFFRCFGAEVGNMALNVLPSGGVFIIGGIAHQMDSAMSEIFLEGFLNKGSIRALLSKYPVKIVLNPSIGMMGARVIARQHLQLRSNIDGINEISPLYSRRLCSSARLDSMSKTEKSRQKLPIGKRLPHAGKSKHPAVWMAAGCAVSTLLVVSFVLGKVFKDGNED